jgi:polar amino acid transport system permease protein
VTSIDTATSTPEAITAVPVRHYGRWIAAVVAIAALVMLLIALYTNKNIDHSTIKHYMFAPAIMEGLRTTIILSVVAQAVGIVIGVSVAVMRLSGNPVLSGIAWLYTWFFRGTPLLVQIIFWGYFGLIFSNIVLGVPYTHLSLASFNVNTVLTAFVAALVALSLNEGAYMSEIVRAGILAVDPGQRQAAHALGMTGAQTMRRVVLPQAMRVIVPPTGNEFISMIKNTSLVSVIAGSDLMTKAQNIYSNNLKNVELLIVVSVWYLAITTVASIGQYYLERHYARGSQQSLSPSVSSRLRSRVISLRSTRAERGGK